MPAQDDAFRGLDPARTDPLNAPVLVARRGRGYWSARPGETSRALRPDRVATAWHDHQPLVIHKPATARRLGLDPAQLEAFDLLELFAFINPAETPPPKLVPTLEEQKEQRVAARDAAVAAKREAKEGAKVDFDPANDPKIKGDPYKVRPNHDPHPHPHPSPNPSPNPNPNPLTALPCARSAATP